MANEGDELLNVTEIGRSASASAPRLEGEKGKGGFSFSTVVFQPLNVSLSGAEWGGRAGKFNHESNLQDAATDEPGSTLEKNLLFRLTHDRGAAPLLHCTARSRYARQYVVVSCTKERPA